jgi:predicted nucleotide-binding protein
MHKRYAILKIESYEGEDTFVRCGNDVQDFLFAIIVIEPDGRVEIIDSGYRSYDEAEQACPDARRETARRD